MYYVNNCQKSTSDKRFVFDVSLKEKNLNSVYTFQAMSYEDYKAWFAIMEGKELTPVRNFAKFYCPCYQNSDNYFIEGVIQLLSQIRSSL